MVHPCFSAAIVLAVIFVERCSSSKDYTTNGIYHNDYRTASGIHFVALILMMSTNLNPRDKYIAIDYISQRCNVTFLCSSLSLQAKHSPKLSLLFTITAFVMLLISSVSFHNIRYLSFSFTVLANSTYVVLVGYMILNVAY